MNHYSLFLQKVFKSSIVTAAVFLIGTQLTAQPWMNDSLKNFYDIQRSFNEYWKDRTVEKGKGWKQFKRWEYFWEQRVAPTGEFPNPMQLIMERPVLKGNKGDLLLNGSTTKPWSAMGPSEAPGGYSGIGRINTITTHPQDPDIIWAGSGSGGLWKSTDGGKSWSTVTDQLPTLGVGDIAIDPVNPEIMYLGTGDGNGNHAYSVGLLKSTNGGETWSGTSLNYNTSQLITISRVLINPDSTNIILVAGSNGIFRSTNSGGTWKSVISGTFKDMEFMPGNPSVVYAGRSNGFVFRSTNGGANWTQLSKGLPGSGGRVAIAVSPSSPEIVYALYANPSNGGYLGLYVSYDNGDTWELTSNTPNILNGSIDGSGVGGQGWYDLALAVSPTDAGEVFVGGINIWRSQDVGETWTKVTSWWNDKSEVEVVHADQHCLYYPPNSSRLFAGNDGGVYSTDNGTEWSWLGNGLQITQFYRLGLSATNPEKYIAGAQDNSTKYFNGSSWSYIETGDGMESAIDPLNENVIYTSSYNGKLKRSMDGGKSFSDITIPDNERGAWITPYMLNPQDPETVFAGFQNVWKSINRGSTWSKISAFSGNSTLNILKVAPSDSNTIYVSTGYGNIRRTTDGGANWTSLSLPVQAVLTSIAIHPSDPQRLWATFSGYSNGNKVFTSVDGGTMWTNISKNLPNIPVNCVIYQNDTPDRLYVGTDVGIYHTDNTLAEWYDFNHSLPNVIVNELEIQYNSKKLRAATFGRGMWEADIILGLVSVNDERTPDNASKVIVMPNPAQNHISIECPAANFEKVQVQLVDLSGKEILKTELQAGENLLKGSLELGGVANGTYLLNIKTALKTYSVKVFVNR